MMVGVLALLVRHVRTCLSSSAATQRASFSSKSSLAYVSLQPSVFVQVMSEVVTVGQMEWRWSRLVSAHQTGDT
jgi:hypothetical protein